MPPARWPQSGKALSQAVLLGLCVPLQGAGFRFLDPRIKIKGVGLLPPRAAATHPPRVCPRLDGGVNAGTHLSVTMWATSIPCKRYQPISRASGALASQLPGGHALSDPSVLSAFPPLPVRLGQYPIILIAQLPGRASGGSLAWQQGSSPRAVPTS